MSTPYRLLSAVLLFVLFAPAASASGDEYADEIHTWQTEREERLVSETGWLTVCGFFWLEPGDNPVGAAQDNLVVLPEGAPDRVGVLRYEVGEEDWTVTLEPAPDIEATVDGEPFAGGEMVPDNPGPATRVTVGRHTFWVLARNGRAAVRVRDPQAPLRTEFLGIDRYPVVPANRVEGRFRAYEETREMTVPNMLGHVDTLTAYGEVVFTLDGSEYSLVPMMDDETDDNLFFVFADATTGTETYEAGRFLYMERQEDGTVVMDFNKAYNPPCAFNPWTTCPLPPESNVLPVAVRAGEKKYAGEHAAR